MWQQGLPIWFEYPMGQQRIKEMPGVTYDAVKKVELTSSPLQPPQAILVSKFREVPSYLYQGVECVQCGTRMGLGPESLIQTIVSFFCRGRANYAATCPNCRRKMNLNMGFDKLKETFSNMERQNKAGAEARNAGSQAPTGPVTAPPLPAGYDYHAFITYRRLEGKNLLANLVKAELEKHGYKVFFDLQSLQAGVFDTGILESLRRSCCDIFILVPGTLDRCLADNAPSADESTDWVRKEIAEASRLKKMIIPLVDDPQQQFPKCDGLPADMASFPRHQAIFFNNVYAAEMITRLCGHINQAVANIKA